MRHKTRAQKAREYEKNYLDIPKDFNERLEYMYDKFNITEKKAEEIINKKYNMINALQYHDFLVVLYEEPEGAARPRTRIINRKNIAQAAMKNSEFVHIYSPNAKEDAIYMQRLLGQDLIQLEHLIYTPCIIEYNAYIKTPTAFNITDTFLSEIGLIRPLRKPDWDNIGKKYSDMYNERVWLDDTLVITGTVNRFYSMLPRVEIKLRYLNMLYNKHQYNSISKRVDFEPIYYK